MKSLLFKPDATCGGSTRESFTVEDESCDPLANIPAPKGINSDTIVAIVLGVISTIAIFVGIYFAMKYAGEPVGNKVKEWGEKAGKIFAGIGKKVPAPIDEGKFEMVNPMFIKKRREEELKKREAAGQALEDRVLEEQRKKKEEEEARKAKEKADEEEAKRVYEQLDAEFKAKEKEILEGAFRVNVNDAEPKSTA
jgi:hypothetical protein